MTISVRLTKEVEKVLREEAKAENMSISDIVNEALEKHHNEYKYFDSISAHHLDPIVVEAFFSLVDTPERADKMSTAGAAMIEKFATYFSEGDNSFETKLKLTIKFLNQNGVKVKETQNGNTISLLGIHHHGEIFSNLLISLFTKLFIKSVNVDIINIKEGAFGINLKTK